MRGVTPALPGYLLLSALCAAAFADPVPPPAQTGPCQAEIDALRPGAPDPGPYLAAAACLLRDSPPDAAAPPDARLKAKLPDHKNWYISLLQRYRGQAVAANARDGARALQAAYLAETADLPDASVWREVAETYAQAGEVYRAGLAYLHQAEWDSTQSGYIQFQLENLFRSAGSEVTPALLLDSLAEGFDPPRPGPSQVLESLCWSYRHYAGAYRNFLARMTLRDPGPAQVVDMAGRFESLGFWDYAANLLDRYPWRQAPKPWQPMARALFLRSHYQMQDWTVIAAEIVDGPGAPKSLGDEEQLIAATALTHLGRPQEALARLQTLDRTQTPASFHARLLKAQAQMSLGRGREAAATLDALKKDPQRREGTGPILFWQGCLALQDARFPEADSLLVLASAYTGNDEAQRALEFRFWLLVDTAAAARTDFFRGLPETPHPAADRQASLNRVPEGSGLWPYARFEKAQIYLQQGSADSAAAELDNVARKTSDRVAGFTASAKAAFLAERTPEGRRAALVRYEDLLVKYQQGVIPEFSRGRIKALKQTREGNQSR